MDGKFIDKPRSPSFIMTKENIYLVSIIPLCCNNPSLWPQIELLAVVGKGITFQRGLH